MGIQIKLRHTVTYFKFLFHDQTVCSGYVSSTFHDMQVKKLAFQLELATLKLQNDKQELELAKLTLQSGREAAQEEEKAQEHEFQAVKDADERKVKEAEKAREHEFKLKELEL